LGLGFFGGVGFLDDLVSVGVSLGFCPERHCTSSISQIAVGASARLFKVQAFSMRGTGGIAYSPQGRYRQYYIGLSAGYSLDDWRFSLGASYSKLIDGNWQYYGIGVLLGYTIGRLSLSGVGSFGWNETGSDFGVELSLASRMSA
jgi:hypothetical protein